MFKKYNKLGKKIKRKKITFVVDDNGCFVCDSHEQMNNGYFTISKNGKRVYMHRHVYQECFGEIPDGNVVRHLCHNKKCINPEHLKAGTQYENIHDTIREGITNSGSRNGMSKLNEEQVTLIKKELRENKASIEFMKSLGEKFGVSRYTIQTIHRGKTWKHVV